MTQVLIEGAINCRTVRGWGCNGFEIVQPVVVRTDTGIGVGLKLNHKETSTQTLEFWQPEEPDLITCWRAMKLLEFLQHIDRSNLEDAYYAALRHQQAEFAEKADRIIGTLHMMSPLGCNYYYMVLGWQIPAEVSDLIVALWDEGIRCDTASVAEELRAGKLAWRDEFTRMGIQKPRENRVRQMFDWLWR